jgi:hypothetical protein
MKRIFYHGTNADNLQSIIKDGLLCHTDKIWTCSSNAIYLWDADRLVEFGECDEDYKNDRAFQLATESAQISCSLAKDCRLVVVKVEIDDEDIEPDYSCENMEGSGAVSICRDILPSEIVEISVSNDLSLIKGYFIALLHERDYCNVEFTKLEKKIAKTFETAEIYPEDIEDIIEWKQINELA